VFLLRSVENAAAMEYIRGVDDGKEYELETENRGTYLYAIVGGLKVTPEIALGYWREIIDECDELGLSKILLEHNFVEMISMAEMVEIIGPVGELLKGRMFAFLDRYGHYDVPEAGKTILRGHEVKMQLFRDVDEAEKWLLAN
jgi:hypothetical protein